MISVEDLDNVDDPLELFRLASEAISQHQAEVDRLADIRARSIAALYARGSSYKELANTLGLSTPRVGQLVSANGRPAIEVFQAWAAIEKTLIDLVGPTGTGYKDVYQDALRILRRSERFDNTARRDLEYLRKTRNEIVHGQISLSIEEAEALTDTAVYLNALLHVILFDNAGESLPTWEAESNQRLDSLQADQPDLYNDGWWSCTYLISPVDSPPSFPSLRETLRAVKGSETGWPPFLALSNRPGMSETIVGNTIECWLREVPEADFWRADPRGRMFLKRRLEEDYAFPFVEPRQYLDLVLPVWRTAECLLHAGRLADRLGAEVVELEMKWHGLAGRELRSLASRPPRSVMPGRICHDPEAKGRVKVPASDIPGSLTELVKALVSPLFVRFDFFEPRDDLYTSEINRMLNIS